MSAFAVPCVLLAVAFELMPDQHLGYVMFFTPAIILLYGASKKGWDVVGLAGNEWASLFRGHYGHRVDRTSTAYGTGIACCR
jgi:hypothetical protein